MAPTALTSRAASILTHTRRARAWLGDGPRARAHPSLVGWPGWWGVPSQPHTRPHSLSDPYTTPLALQGAHTQQSLASVPCSEQAALERRWQGLALGFLGPVGFLGPRRSGEMQPAGPVGAEPAQRARSVVG